MNDIIPPFWSLAGVKAVLFDWDGVLAQTRLDFSGVRARFFGGSHVPLLECAATLPEDERKAVMDALHDLEMEGAASAEPIDGVREIMDWLSHTEKPWGVVSRNCREAVELAASRVGISLPDVTIAREDCRHQKPDPRSLWKAAVRLGVPHTECAFVGDYLYDVIGARRASMRAVLVERIEPSWEPWVDVSYKSVRQMADAIAYPVPLVPWEYKDIARKRGREVLARRFMHPVCIPCPENLFGFCSKIIQLAGLGFGDLRLLKPGELTPERWKSANDIPTMFMGEPLETAIAKFCASRYPMCRVTRCPDEQTEYITPMGQILDELSEELA